MEVPDSECSLGLDIDIDTKMKAVQKMVLLMLYVCKAAQNIALDLHVLCKDISVRSISVKQAHPLEQHLLSGCGQEF